MTPRARRRVLYYAVVSGGVMIGAACTFPEVVFDRDASDGEGGTVDGGTDATVLADGDKTPEADPPIDGTSQKPDTGPCTDPCDCDKDTFRSKKDACGGNDCDDDDSRANPNANFSKELVTKETKGDWNCNGTPERLHKIVGEKCEGSGALPEACPSGKSGLKFDIPCGATGEFIVCENKGAITKVCTLVDSGLVTQECR